MCRKAKQSKAAKNQAIVRINVTDLTLKQRRQLFIDAMNQVGFCGFIKHNNAGDRQTHYSFTYNC